MKTRLVFKYFFKKKIIFHVALDLMSGYIRPETELKNQKKQSGGLLMNLQGRIAIVTGGGGAITTGRGATVLSVAPTNLTMSVARRTP
jgi:hypothetical protein